ncbi:MAG: tRNA (guanosine(37)-N1)-methyltransferase TrmD [Anaerotignum sp.]|jgi:tRNA (guanine37-N1)-methyltransferase|nr:tRNA (guanosine(37)-N1)-methyltransferase TrmD [Anaerotignum sp.]MCI8867498.1 tRNA (guanosine(37)-N1)-methyltransferase TrmD [Anaerotignum sp.]
MKQYFILTLFPEMVEQTLSHSIMGRAQKDGLISIKAVNIRDYTLNKQKHVDDYPYGGGAGMLMQGQPIYDAYQSIMPQAAGARVVYLTPQGRTFTQSIAEELAREESLVFLCGHYEGIDERLIEEIVTDELSIGDFVLTGGELAAAAVIDAVSRLTPGVLGKEESFVDESFSDGLLEYPQYTRPPVFMGREVPEVLLSGHHENVAKWRREQALLRTAEKRPDLLAKAVLTEKDRLFLRGHGIDIVKKGKNGKE